MSTRNDGGMAFPAIDRFEGGLDRDNNQNFYAVGSNGMSLRDYFAGQVLAGWNEGYHSIAWKVGEETPGLIAIAATAYQIADAMLREREKPEAKG